MITANGHQIVGSSVSSLGTALGMKGENLIFDLGIVPKAVLQLRHALITHGHIDHMAGIVPHASLRKLRGMKPSRFIMPSFLVEKAKQILDLWGQLDHGTLDYEIISLDPGEEYRLSPRILVRPFETHHTVPSQGYALYGVKKKLKEEFRGFPQEEIRKLRVEQGVEVSEPVESLLVVYTGDTTIDTVKEVDEIRYAPLLITESTFISPDLSDEFAQKRGHIHLRQWADLADEMHNKAIVLTHFSDRYDPPMIREALDTLPLSLKERITPLILTKE